MPCVHWPRLRLWRFVLPSTFRPSHALYACVPRGVPRSPHFGVAHALCLGLAPWLAAEVPYMVETGVIKAKV